MHFIPSYVMPVLCFYVVAMNPAQANVGEAQRLSSLTFGCFQIRGKNPQVLTGPEPSQKSISTLPDQDHTHVEGRRPSTGKTTHIMTSLKA